MLESPAGLWSASTSNESPGPLAGARALRRYFEGASMSPT